MSKTIGQIKILKPGNSYFMALTDNDDIQKYLKYHYNVDSDLSEGLFGLFSSANKYSKNGKSLSHKEIIGMIKAHNPKFYPESAGIHYEEDL